MGYLSLLIFLPVAGAVAILATPRERVSLHRTLAVLFSGAAFVLSGWMACQFDKNAAGMQWVESFSWIPKFYVNYALGADGLRRPDMTGRNDLSRAAWTCSAEAYRELLQMNVSRQCDGRPGGTRCARRGTRAAPPDG